MHLDDEQIQRLLHGELDAHSKEVLSMHVADCNECAQRIASSEREEAEIFGLLEHLDHPAPRVEAGTFVRGHARFGTWGRRVAGFVVAAALAGAAYALPGSPLPAFVKKAVQWVSGTESTTPAGVDSTSTSEVTSGIAVPVAPRFSITFVANQEQGVIAVSLTDGPNVVVRALHGSATFTTDVDRLTVDNRGSSADYEIEIPRDAPFLEVRVGTGRFVLKDGDRFASDGFAVDARGRVVIPLMTPEN